MKMQTLRDWDNEKLLVSKELNNGDWNYRLFIKVLYLEDYLPEDELKEWGKYEVEILAVSPEACGKVELAKAIESGGYDDRDIEITDLMNYEALVDYGIFATLFSAHGNNLGKLLKKARQELIGITMLFGFYMDRQENMIGNDGWDFISGNIGFKSLRKDEDDD